MTPCSGSGLFESLSSPILGGKARLEMAGRKNHSPEDIVRLLQRFDELLGKGMTVELACREIGVSTASYYKWRQRYDGMSVDDAKELKELRVENAKLKRLVADSELEKLMLKEIAKGKF
jgi:putative transposase